MRLITGGDNSAPSYGFKPSSVKDYGFYGAMGAMITEQYLDKDRRDNVNAYAVLSDPTGRNIAVYFIEGFKKKCQAIADNGKKNVPLTMEVEVGMTMGRIEMTKVNLKEHTTLPMTQDLIGI